MVVGGIFCCLEKAFDCVNHNILLTKIKFYGITGTAYKLIKSYLEGRYQRMDLNNISLGPSSNWGEIKHGVPQRSLLGPLLFLIYINDLLKISNDESKIVLFIDDASIITTNPKPTNFKNSVIKMLKDINSWCSTNLLSPNTDKTHFMQFVTKSSSLIDLYITHENKKIANICNKKFLRITLDNTLTWKTNIDMIIPKLGTAFFYVLLTVHLSIFILVINQIDVQNFVLQ